MKNLYQIILFLLCANQGFAQESLCPIETDTGQI